MRPLKYSRSYCVTNRSISTVANRHRSHPNIRSVPGWMRCPLLLDCWLRRICHFQGTPFDCATYNGRLTWSKFTHTSQSNRIDEMSNERRFGNVSNKLAPIIGVINRRICGPKSVWRGQKEKHKKRTNSHWRENDQSCWRGCAFSLA